MNMRYTSEKKIKTAIFILFGIMFFCSLFNPVQAEDSEYLGYYEYTMYFDYDDFTGRSDLTSSQTSDQISTYFGTYPNVIIVERSTYKLEHPNRGYIEISNSKNYFDTNYNLIKSTSTWKVRLSGYYEETFTMTYEFGNYVVLQNTPTVYEETYTMRYYENGYYQKSTACRDYTAYETTETITVPAGTYECARLKTTYYENSVYSGYTRAWIDINGKLIQQYQYDESNALIWVTKLKSESQPIQGWEVALWVLGGIGVFILSIAVYTKLKRRPTTSGDGKKTQSDYRYKPIYQNSRTRDAPTYKYSTSSYTQNYPSPKSNCPLCSGTGIIKTPSGILLCPLCKK